MKTKLHDIVRSGFFTSILVLLFIGSSYHAFSQSPKIITDPAQTTWNVPTGVTSVTVECWGAGGSGGSSANNAAGGGAGGGAYSRSLNIVVVPETTVEIQIGAGALTSQRNAAGTAGGNTWFLTPATVYAEGGSGGAFSTTGTGGAGGDAANGIGNDATLSGGNGTNGTGVQGGDGGAGANGGVGGTGGNNVGGNPGSPPGGGGGGSGGRNNVGAAGANGQIVITYTISNDPTITLGTFPEVCEGITSANLPFTATTNSPNQYSIDYVDDVSLTDVVLQPLGTPPGNIPLDITGATPGVYDAFLTVTNEGTSTTSSPYAFTVTVFAIPTAPGTSPVTYCEGDTASPLTATGTNLLWYTTPTGGTGGGTAPTPSTVSAGTTTYYVSQTVNNCEGPRASLVVTVNALPSAPVTSPVTYCEGDTASALTATGTNLLWYTTPTGGTGSGTAPTPSTASAGTTTYYVSQTVNNCEGPRASLVVTVNALPTAPGTSPVTYCEEDTASPLTATGTNLLWYTTPTGGTGSGTAPTPSTVSAGTATYYVSQTVNNCEGPRASLIVTVNVPPTPAVAGDNKTITVSSTTLEANSPTIGTGSWSVVSAPSTSLSQFDDTASNNAIFTPDGGNGDYVLRWTISNNPCSPSTDDVTITVNVIGNNAPIVTVPATQNVCEGSTLTLGNPPSIADADNDTQSVTITITNGTLDLVNSGATINGDGTNSITITNDANATLTNINNAFNGAIFTPSITSGTANVQIATNDGNGGAETKNFDITVNVLPSAPGTGPVTYCEGDTANPLTATGTNLLWYTTPTGGTGNATAPTPSTVSAGTATYYVSQTVNNCEGPRASLIVTVNAPPTPAVAMDNQNISDASTTLEANSPTIGTGVWSIISGPSTNLSQFSSTSDNAATFTPSGGVGDYVLRWTISNAPCADSWSEVTITTTYVPSSPPTITLTDPNPLVVQGGNSTNLIYIATTNNPNKYSITFDATALGQLFVNVTDAPLPPSPIALSVPTAALLGTYNGILTVKNSITTLTSVNYPITITVTNTTNHSLYNCTSCHITHNAPGSTLTAVAGNALLCQSCHTSTGAASAKPLVNADKGVSSHAWDVLAQNDAKEVLPPLNSQMQLRIVDNKIICSTCHNQHENSDGTPYLRIDNTGDLLCKDCHRKRDKGLYSTDNVNNRGSHPVGVTYDDTDTRFKNTQTLVTNGSMVQCSTCHGVHDIQTPSVNNLTTDGNLLRMSNDVNLCTDCHNYSDHMGMNCLDCHEVHNMVDGTVDNNIYMIKSSITTPFSGNKPVIFTAETGNNSFADGLGAETPGNEKFDGICEVCHAPSIEGGKPVSHFVNNGSGSDQYHEILDGVAKAGKNCTTCHSHSDGFIPSGGSCHGCHDATPGAFKYPLASEGYTEGAHPLHVGTYEFTCDTCHYLRGSGGANEGSHPGGTKDIVFNPSGLASANGSTPSWDGATCSNVYCHSDGGASDGSTITYVQTPNWIGGSVSCGDCHNVPSSNGSHTAHTSTPYNFACTTCHVGINGTTDPPTANHVNGTLGPEEFDPSGMAGATASWNGTTSTCSSVYCHSDGNGTFQPTTPDWYSGAIACGDCHTVTPSSGAHSRHTDGVMYNFACSTCHNGAIVPSSPPTNGHINGTIGPPEFDLSGLATRNGNDANTPVFNANKTCDNVFCHSHGQSAEGTSTGNTQRDGITPLGITWEIAGTVPRTPPALPTFVTTPAWDTGTLPECGGCHLGSLTPTSSTTDWPQSGQHTGKGAHLVTCWWCHNTTGDQTYIGTYGTAEHVDGDVWFIPELFSDGGTFHNLPVPTGGDGNTASSGHCGSTAGGGKTCWY